MKIFKCLIMVIIILTTNVFCLKVQTFDTTRYYGKMNYVFANVDKSQVTTGMLIDNGIEFLDLENFTG